MVKNTKKTIETEEQTNILKDKPSFHDLQWTEYVLNLLTEDEKISGNPTTDGLRRIFEIALNANIISSTSDVVQCPNMENEKRATVVHSISFIYHDKPEMVITVDGAADVYWGNCDKIYRNHPVAVAETRAEGRALRRGLRLRKVVAAEELAKDIEDNSDNINKITNNQINFIDVLSRRLNIDVKKLIHSLAPDTTNIYNIEHDTAVKVVQSLTGFQQSNNIPNELLGYNSEWK